MEMNENKAREIQREELAEAVGGTKNEKGIGVLVYMCSKCKVIKKVIGRPGMAAPKCPVCQTTMDFIRFE